MRLLKGGKGFAYSLKRIIKLGVYSSLSSVFALSLYANYRHKSKIDGFKEFKQIKEVTQTLTNTFAETVTEQLSQHLQVNPQKFETLSDKGKIRFLENLLNDPEGRVSQNFKVPKNLKNQVLFWFKVFNIYSNTDIILHNINEPWKIYTVVDTSGLSGKERFLKVREALKQFPQYQNQIRQQQGMKNSVAFALEKSGRYMKNMEKIFRENKLPVELVRLPIVESSFNPQAYSKVGAAGLWQFMRKTGKHFLESINTHIDERLSPFKATEAAAQLLKENFQILGSWPLAVSAYHHGPGLILKAKKVLGTNDLGVMISTFNHPQYQFASKNYYTEFLAAVYTEKYHDKLFEDLEKEKPLKYDDVILGYSMRVKAIMDICRISLEELKLYNPDLKTQAFQSSYYLPENHWLKLPQGKKKYMDQFHKEAEEARKFMEGLKS
ncbi:MAG: lytic transglycosylase domain-containing protein [Deltaproteobacteria bacterium]|nr:lytic transglycosylase domain-containing protein [Deltaproteobacteria bacterium]